MKKVFQGKFLVLLLILSTISIVWSKQDQGTDRLIGNILKMNVERYHYRKLSVNDDLSQRAYAEYLKKIDYSKLFLTQKDVKGLNQYQFKLDDELVSGDIVIVKDTLKIMKKRINLVDQYRKEFFKKGFTFSLKESLEVDPKKRDFPKNEKDLKEMWRKTFKQQTMSRYISYLEEKEDYKKDKNKEKNKKDKKLVKNKKKSKDKKDQEKPIHELTEKEMKAKAHKMISKKYQRYFTRLKKDRWSDFSDKFFNSITSIFDPHTTYLAPKKKEDFDIEISGSLEGIGAVLQEDEAYIKVVKVVPGGAAWRQKGLEVGDLILAVAQGKGEAVDLVEMRVDDAVRYIRGKKGTEVRLTVKKSDGKRKIIPIIRDVVHVGASFAKSSILEHKSIKGKIGYINLPKFYRDFSKVDVNCTQDVKKELIRLKKQNVKAMILDLRNNGGGALPDAQEMSGLFIKKGPIVQVKGHSGQVDVLKDLDPSVTYGGPLIVLMNRFSASASEILAAALQDYKRAIIVGGEYSHGKGTVQAIVSLTQNPLLNLMGGTKNELGALKLTIQKFYRINGKSTQYKGVTPDIILPDPYGHMESREQDLDYSLPWDKIKKLDYVLWKDAPKYKMDILKKRSAKRIKKNVSLQKIAESVDFLKKRKDDTLVTLNLVEQRKKDKENDLIIDKLKNDKENKDIKVSYFEPSLLEHKTINKKDKKQWEKDFKQQKEEWVSGLQKDSILEEAMFIAADMIKMSAGKKLSVAKR